MDISSIRNIYAAGRNYAAHADELGNARPSEPILFAKSVASLTTKANLRFPKVLGAVHHELEIVLRIGRDVPLGQYRDLSVVDAVGLGLDMTARERQQALAKAGLPWFLGKNFQDAAFLAPMKVGADPAERYHFRLSRGGETIQCGDTELMLFPPDALLRTLNRTMPLSSGDLIFTGTPAGVGPVAHGDRLRLHCEALDVDCEVAVSFVS